MTSTTLHGTSPGAPPKEPAPPPGAAAPTAGAVRAGLCAVCTLAGWYLQGTPTATVAFVLAYLAGAAGPAAAMLHALRRRELSVDLLMILAALGAAAIGDVLEGAVLLFLFSLSGALEAYALYRTTHSIEALMQLRPREATLVRDGEESRVAVEALPVGALVRVRPGERFPVDGEVAEGKSWADEATLTGESTPVPKEAGSPVFAGTINGRGSVLVRMTRAAADTTLERIVRMVREAQAEKTAAQQFVEAWQAPYVVTVLTATLLTLLGSRLLHDQDWHDACYHAMVLLVVASPCAVVVGSPAVMLSAIARAARQGVLFKGGRHLDLLGRVEVMAFDKTGTITVGRPRVTTVWASDGAEDRLLGRIAALEQHSEHHLAEAVVHEAQRRGVSMPPATDFENHTGLGVHGRVEGRWVGVGRLALFTSHEVPVPETVLEAAQRCQGGGQTVLLAVVPEEQTGGVLVLADTVRPDAAAALAALKRLGVVQHVLLTGDHEHVARAVAERVGADDVRAGLLPEEKVLELRRLMQHGRCLAMVGDGVNDAPALATAQVGIAMGGAGTDVALEVADVVLMRDDLNALAFAVWLSRRARRRVRQNLTFAFGMIGLLVLSSFFGLPLWLGVIGHEGSTVLVLLNGLRLLWDRPPNGSASPVSGEPACSSVP